MLRTTHRRIAAKLALLAFAVLGGVSCLSDCDDRAAQEEERRNRQYFEQTFGSPTPAGPHTITPGPARTPLVVTATVTPPPSEHRYAAVTPIRATFDQATFTTTYRVRVTGLFPQGAYVRWTGPNCGTVQDEVKSIPRNEAAAFREDEIVVDVPFAWTHPHPPCDSGNHDDVTVVATLYEGGGRAPQLKTICTYRGSDTGTGPTCQLTSE